jgi:chromosome segregation ATPase
VKDPLWIIGSLGALGTALAALIGVAQRVGNWRTERRKAESEVDGLNLDNLQKAQTVWGESFARLEREMDNLRTEMSEARSSWEEKRAELQERVDHLETVVERLRTQIRDELHGVPVA